MNLTELLAQYAANPAPEGLEPILQALPQAQVYVPAAADPHLVPAQGNLLGVRPDAIPAGPERVLFPVFSDPSQVPDHYGARFTFLHVPLAAFTEAARQDPRFAGIVIDPFTARFLLSAGNR